MIDPPLAAVVAPEGWHRLEFISDLHLSESDPGTFEAWQHYMQTTQADAVFILGDLFEAWVGDDVLAVEVGHSPAFEARCAQVVADLVRGGTTRPATPVFYMHGNRDFLTGQVFLRTTGMRMLTDPCVLTFSNQRYLLSHGDALCLQDIPYMQWRALVRTPQWQETVLARPLAERRLLAQQIRDEKLKGEAPAYTDIDPQEAVKWLEQHQSRCLVHGHTHQPGESVLAPGYQRQVLSDWDHLAQPSRAQVLRLEASGWHRLDLK